MEASERVVKTKGLPGPGCGRRHGDCLFGILHRGYPPRTFETEAEGICIGHADNYCQVSVPSRDLRGLVKNVKIEGLKDKILVGYTVLIFFIKVL